MFVVRDPHNPNPREATLTRNRPKDVEASPAVCKEKVSLRKKIGTFGRRRKRSDEESEVSF